MAFAAGLVELQAETSCPVCLDYLRHPVTLDCGHNFCGSCIQQRWEDLRDIFPCPLCLHHCADRSPPRNTQLSHLVDIVKQLPGQRGPGQEEEPLCEKHSQGLTLLCEEDLELLCPRCRVCSDHQGHLLMPLGPAAARHRQKLKSFLELLKCQVEVAQAQCEMQISKSIELKWKMENHKEELGPEFKELLVFLKREQVAIDARMLAEEMVVGQRVTENKSQLLSHLSTLEDLLLEIPEKCLQADLDLLASVKTLHSRCEDLQPPGVFSCELQKESCPLPPHYLGLHNIIRTFQADLTLDPKKAHPGLLVSRDRKSVTMRAVPPELLRGAQGLLSYPRVQSGEGFEAGRHFWQVEVRGPGVWSLGVCNDSVCTKGLRSISLSPGSWQFQPSLWALGPETPEQIVRIGVFLDYELGELSFFDLNNRSFLYSFTDIFTGKLTPCFSFGTSSKSLTLSLLS
ncbi:PREDICTED: tripartite motif-containing protein 60-like [Condylura cristata]|uniref:tripartite motif-containing protein 60-like n=1 Tax=Condylura cristata TaxID=143302 RepID=UPI0003345514|nr:PREDICTED: tripartite motif-containing protein 60-like [Condylura cristata]